MNETLGDLDRHRQYGYQDCGLSSMLPHHARVAMSRMVSVAQSRELYLAALCTSCSSCSLRADNAKCDSRLARPLVLDLPHQARCPECGVQRVCTKARERTSSAGSPTVSCPIWAMGDRDRTRLALSPWRPLRRVRRRRSPTVDVGNTEMPMPHSIYSTYARPCCPWTWPRTRAGSTWRPPTSSGHGII